MTMVPAFADKASKVDAAGILETMAIVHPSRGKMIERADGTLQ